MFQQLKAILWKNWLLKWAHPWSTTAEFMLPVTFMVLLIIIKEISNLYDSPNIAYYCGNTYPWYYTYTIPESMILLDCMVKPPNCSKDHYYQEKRSIKNFDYHIRYGYVESGASSGISSNPFYAFTVADSSSVYPDLSIDNPSPPLAYMLQRMKSANAILAICPTKANDQLMSEIRHIKTYMLNQTSDVYMDTIVLFHSEKDLENYIVDTDYDDKNYKHGKVGIAIVLETAQRKTAQWEYKIRTNFTYDWEVVGESVSCLYGSPDVCPFTYSIPSTDIHTQDLEKPQSMSYLYGYAFSGFSTLQLVIDMYIFRQYALNQTTFATVGLMPTTRFVSDDFQYVISSVLGIFYVLSFLYPVSRIIRALVLEKELRIKEGMKMMGLTDFSYNTSWFITILSQMVLVALFITLATSTTVFQYSDKFFVFVYFLSFSVAVMNMCFMLATFFNRAKVAALVGPMLFFASFFPYYAVQDPSYPTSSKTAACLLAPACFALGSKVFADYEGGLVGVQSDNIANQTSNFSYSLCVSMMIVDAVIYGVLAWYFDKVLPTEFGTRMPIYFPFMPTYWWRFSNRASAIQAVASANESNNNTMFESVPLELSNLVPENKCICIRSLRKVFYAPGASRYRVAVKSLNFDIFPNQITVLLGHNSAGKSTVVNMLTGLVPPTSGDALVFGHSIRSDMQSVRSILGVCPQHDILFPELTVIEHLFIFAKLKGVAANTIQNAVNAMIIDVGLEGKEDVRAANLSGGTKRKLCVGIALIGDPQILILDEPTSGMDPYSRRLIWNLLQRYRNGHTILLITHFMDEADVLGDRIAIMSVGDLCCCGSSLFLKQKYGVGYMLSVSKESKKIPNIPITHLVTSVVHEAEILSAIGAEVLFRLPFTATSVFADLFNQLDTMKAALNIAQYGISATTLEEVFRCVGRDAEHSRPESCRAIGNSEYQQRAATALAELELETAATVFLKHFQVLFWKRFTYSRRDKRFIICQIILPVILIAVGFGLLLLRPPFDQADLVLSVQHYNPHLNEKYRNFVPMNTMESNFAQEISEKFHGDDSSGVYGVSVHIAREDDKFYGCSSGSTPLHNMSNFLLSNGKPKNEKGASRYGSVTFDSNTSAHSLIYNVLVNGSAVHGAGVFMNIICKC